MFKSALAIVLLANVHALNLNARTEGKHDFIKAMRKSQKVNGMLPRKLSNDKLIAKSVHKPGLRSSTAQEIIKARRRVILSFVIQGYRSPCSVSSKGGDGTATIPIGSTLIPFLNKWNCIFDNIFVRTIKFFVAFVRV